MVVRFAPGNRMEVFMDGLAVCYRQLPGVPPANLNLNVWASNPWDVSAAAWVERMSYTPLSMTPTNLLSSVSIKVVRNMLLTSTLKSHSSYRLRVAIFPVGKFHTWTNLFRLQERTGDCCAFGQRIPSVWFIGNTWRLHFRTDTSTRPNSGCDTPELAGNRWTNVEVQVHNNKQFYVFFNGRRVCAQTLQGNLYPSGRNLRVYVADPMYTAANAWLKDLSYTRL